MIITNADSVCGGTSLWCEVRTPLCDPVGGCSVNFPNFVPVPTVAGVVLFILVLAVSIVAFRYIYGRFPFDDTGTVTTKEAVIRFSGKRPEGSVNQVHDLKCWTASFQALRDLIKKFELRKNDRNYLVGDILLMREWNPDTKYTGRFDYYRVTWILYSGFGLPEGFCIMSVNPVEIEIESIRIVEPPAKDKCSGQ